MQVLFAYLIKLGLCLAIGYLFYVGLLRRMTWYSWNRYFLLFFPLAALIIPMIPVELPQQVQPLNAVFYITDALPSSGNTTAATTVQSAMQWSLVNIALLVIAAGTLFFLCRFAVRIYSLYKTRSMAKLVNGGDIKLYHLPGCTAPFSFYDGIYLDTEHYESSELENILEHELVHVTQKHTLDILVAETLCIVQWFNPFAWMMKQAMKQNLEFIADDSVLRKGVNRKGYQYLLLKVSGAMPHSIATNLLFPSLKKRIHMMNKDRTGKLHLLKFLCILPLACLLIFAFSTQTGRPPVHTNGNEFSVSSVSFYINDAQAAQIIQKDQANSLLKKGGELSLALIDQEKTRLKTLLERNGYDTSGGRAISFVMDTAVNNKSYAVKIVVDGLTKERKTSPAVYFIGAQNVESISKMESPEMKKALAMKDPVTVRDNTAILGPIAGR